MGKSFEEDTATGKCCRVRTSSEKKQNRRKVVKFFADSGDSGFKSDWKRYNVRTLRLYHLDEVVAEENFYALEENFQEEEEET